MKHSINFITSAPISYTIPKHDLYDSFDLVSKGIISAPLACNARKAIKSCFFNFEINDIEVIYTAEKGQTLETAKLIHSLFCKKAKIIPTYLLNNIQFSMNQLISKKEFNAMKREIALNKTRKKFILNLYQNKLTESFQSINKRIDELLAILEKEDRKTLCISHSFYMKLIEIYTSDQNNFRDQNKLVKTFNPRKKPYGPLSGFRLT